MKADPFPTSCLTVKWASRGVHTDLNNNNNNNIKWIQSYSFKDTVLRTDVSVRRAHSQQQPGVACAESDQGSLGTVRPLCSFITKYSSLLGESIWAAGPAEPKGFWVWTPVVCGLPGRGLYPILEDDGKQIYLHLNDMDLDSLSG